MHLRAPSSCLLCQSANHVRRCTLSPQTLPLPAYPNDVRAARWIDRSRGHALRVDSGDERGVREGDWDGEQEPAVERQRRSGARGACGPSTRCAEATWPVPGDAHGCLGACELFKLSS
jgi:CO dehydrogenase/acetyl-CoA synthase beta subunit